MSRYRASRQRCDHSFVPPGNLDRHPELGITTQVEVKCPRIRTSICSAGRIIGNNMISSSCLILPSEQFNKLQQHYTPSNDLIAHPHSVSSPPEKTYRSNVRNFSAAFGDGSNFSPKETYRRKDFPQRPNEQPSSVTSLSRGRRGLPDPLQVRSNPELTSLPPGPIVVNENSGWYVSYNKKRTHSSVENRNRSVSKEAPEWFKVDNCRVKAEGPRYHPLGQNGRKEQVLSAASPEWFLGDRSPDIKRTSIPRVDPNIAYCGKIIL
jgi:hypothetical protein